MVTDSELVVRLREFLRTSDLNTTTTSILRLQLEEDFGIDLSDKRAFIREQVDLYLQSDFEKTEENEEGDDARDESEGNAEEEAPARVRSEEVDQGVEEEEEEEDDQETSNDKAVSKRKSKKQKTEVKKRGGGFTKLCSLSPELQKFVGVPELARTEVVKQLWGYIREKNLQDPSNKRIIICDETLGGLFGVDCIDMFQMSKALTKHIWPLNSDHDPVRSEQKQKQKKQESEEDSNEAKRKQKQQKGERSSGFLAPLPLSDALVKFLGTGEIELSRSEVVKRIWDYIKQNNLQDPTDKRRIISDDKLKELFDVDSFHGFTVSKLLTVHFMKRGQ